MKKLAAFGLMAVLGLGSLTGFASASAESVPALRYPISTLALDKALEYLTMADEALAWEAALIGQGRIDDAIQVLKPFKEPAVQQAKSKLKDASYWCENNIPIARTLLAEAQALLESQYP